MMIFSSKVNITHWPIHFAIVKATDLVSADNNLGTSSPAIPVGDHLKENYTWVRHLIAANMDTSRADDYWAVAMGWNDACNLAQSAGLETVFYVSDNTLSVSYCDERRKPIYVDSFLKRFSAERGRS